MSIFKRTVLFVIIISFIMGVFILPFSARVALSGISARSAILVECESGEVYYEKNAHERLPMASTTKIMTALVAIERTNVRDTAAIDARAVGVEGSSVYLREGELLTMEELLYAMLLESANDAAAAIAIEVGGSIEGFALLMNEKAEELGLRNTHFENPHGLDGESHYTTASDLAKIACEAMKNETFAHIVSTQKKVITAPDGNRYLANHNKLLRNYEGAIGIKTGFTKKSGRCLVSAAERDGLRLVAVTLNAPDDWNDHKIMFDSAFSAYHRVCAIEAGGYTLSLPVIGGKDQTVLCKNNARICAVLPKSTEISDCIFSYELPRFLYADIEKGEIVGRIICSSKGEIIGESEIVAIHSVEKVKYKTTLWQRIRTFFASVFG